MTQEEKAKCYDEAIERAKVFKKHLLEINEKDYADEMNYIFPALKESEDERIRKALIFHYQGNGCICTNEYRIDFKDICVWLEKQGEQKPADWSKEDQDNFKHLMDEIVCLGNNRDSSKRLYYDRLIKFLEELKKRAQPREKWCDKDERMLDRLIAYFEKRVAFTDDDNQRYANWLKSLRPQSQWRPSDEQIFALQGTLPVIKGGGTYQQSLLESLYEDLKKLKS